MKFVTQIKTTFNNQLIIDEFKYNYCIFNFNVFQKGSLERNIIQKK